MVELGEAGDEAAGADAGVAALLSPAVDGLADSVPADPASDLTVDSEPDSDAGAELLDA